MMFGTGLGSNAEANCLASEEIRADFIVVVPCFLPDALKGRGFAIGSETLATVDLIWETWLLPCFLPGALKGRGFAFGSETLAKVDLIRETWLP